MFRFCQILFLLLFAFFIPARGQSTWQEVYSIFQGNCTAIGCHNAFSKAGNLDLAGTGLHLPTKMQQVYEGIYNTRPSNVTSANRNEKLVFPGDPYRSFLFRKVSHSITDNYNPGQNEGDKMPPSGQLTAEQAELIRQWILFGAKQTGWQADTALINRFYQDGGIESVPAPPLPPPPGFGFQIHLGPYFLAPGQEQEYFLKCQTPLKNDRQVSRIFVEMGNFSHHFVLFRFLHGMAAQVPAGLRTQNAHQMVQWVMVNQFSDTLQLPENSAFLWEKNAVLDLNTHYINYSPTKVLAADVYINVYTHPATTFPIIMRTAYIDQRNFSIPNTGEPVVIERHSTTASDTGFLYIWGISSHSHQLSKDFNIYQRFPDGGRGPQIFDAGCPGGMPGCFPEFFDYAHPPIRYMLPMQAIRGNEGLIMEAVYLNDGPDTVHYGLTAADEMMGMILFFTRDTTVPPPPPPDDTVSIRDISLAKDEILLYPNPFRENLFVYHNSKFSSNCYLEVYHAGGQKWQISLSENEGFVELPVAFWPNGLFYYSVKTETGLTLCSGKLLRF